MPVLKNQRHEAFAQAIAKGESATEAYLSAGYKVDNKVAQVSGSRLMAIAIINNRILQLKHGAAEKVELTKAWVLSRLMDNVDTSLGRKPFKKTITNKETGGRETVEIFERDTTAANQGLSLLGKELAMFIERKEIGGVGEFAKMSDEEIDAQLAEMVGEVEGTEARH